MSLGMSDMAGSALGTAFSLLLLASLIQGRQDVEVFYNKKMEAVVGQNVTLPCIINSSTDLKLVSVEWSKNKNENTKLALYSPGHGQRIFWPNITIQTENNLTGSYLHLSQVAKWDSGIYFCDLTTFPQGTIRKETELKIKDVDVKIMCDVNSTVEVHTGENATIHCSAFPNAQYKWTKNKEVVSENESLELWWVTDAHTGIYTLTVNTGDKSLHKEFNITVLTATTSLKTDLVTVSPQSNITEAGPIESADSGLTMSPTITSTTSMGTDVTDDPSNVTITAGERITPFTNHTHINVTLSPATHTDPHQSNTSNGQEINMTHSLNTSTFSDQSAATDLSTTSSYGSAEFRSTQETRSDSTGSIEENPGATPTTKAGKIIPTPEVEDTDHVRSHLLLVLVIVPMLVLITVAGFIYRRQIMKQRLDLPPPFKPPPPPIKYTAVRRHEISTQFFPISRCNSVTELKNMKQTFVHV